MSLLDSANQSFFLYYVVVDGFCLSRALAYKPGCTSSEESEREERKSSEHFTTVGFNSVKPIGKRHMTIQFCGLMQSIISLS